MMMINFLFEKWCHSVFQRSNLVAFTTLLISVKICPKQNFCCNISQLYGEEKLTNILIECFAKMTKCKSKIFLNFSFAKFQHSYLWSELSSSTIGPSYCPCFLQPPKKGVLKPRIGPLYLVTQITLHGSKLTKSAIDLGHYQRTLLLFFTFRSIFIALSSTLCFTFGAIWKVWDESSPIHSCGSSGQALLANFCNNYNII